MAVVKFQFPSRGFCVVATKVAEANYFLHKLRGSKGYNDEFNYHLSAFASAARSITFSMQCVMSKYPGFDEWYVTHQEHLRSNCLAKYFVNLRNYMQKVGDVPVEHTGTMAGGEFKQFSFFVDTEGLEGAPDGEVTGLAEEYFVAVLKVVEECYRDFSVFVDPRVLFTEEGLERIGWVIEDIEEAVGLPRGWTDVPYEGGDKNHQRLRILARNYQGDEMLEKYFKEFGLISPDSDRS